VRAVLILKTSYASKTQQGGTKKPHKGYYQTFKQAKLPLSTLLSLSGKTKMSLGGNSKLSKSRFIRQLQTYKKPGVRPRETINQ